jgi:hypothetical protein
MFDAELYRDKDREWKNEDPIPQFEQFLLQKAMDNGSTALRVKLEKISISICGSRNIEPLDQLTKLFYSETGN